MLKKRRVVVIVLCLVLGAPGCYVSAYFLLSEASDTYTTGASGSSILEELLEHEPNFRLEEHPDLLEALGRGVAYRFPWDRFSLGERNPEFAIATFKLFRPLHDIDRRWLRREYWLGFSPMPPRTRSVPQTPEGSAVYPP